MTSWIAASARGREAARRTNSSFRLRQAVDVRPGDPNLLSGARPWEVIGDCGHVIHTYRGYLPPDGSGRDVLLSKRHRCPQCPKSAPTTARPDEA